MALNMNGFSDSLSRLPRRINAPVLSSAAVAFAAGIGAALIFSGPGAVSSEVVTAAAPAMEKSCATQTWPYRDQNCRDAEAVARKLRDVRIVSTDRTQPARVVQSAVAQDAASKPAAASIAQAEAASKDSNRQYAATWPMSVDQMPSHATLTPPIGSLSLASAKLLPPATSQAAPAIDPPAAAAAPLQSEPAAPAMAPQKRIRTAAKPPVQRTSRDHAALMLVRTYEFADGRQVTVRHRLKSGDDRPGLEADGVLSYASSRNARMIRDHDEDYDD